MMNLYFTFLEIFENCPYIQQGRWLRFQSCASVHTHDYSEYRVGGAYRALNTVHKGGHQMMCKIGHKRRNLKGSTQEVLFQTLLQSHINLLKTLLWHKTNKIQSRGHLRTFSSTDIQGMG